ncbi:MAG: hypothetical protein HYZ14_17620 [Bacteroidetes bacterium]|nr:hypothetical protein [Bacteroidota bacterium]
MTDKETILKTFVDNFVLKDKRERCFLELINPKKRNKFIDRLNHKWDTVLNMNYLVQIDKTKDNINDIQNLLNFKDSDICYVISNYSDYDDKYLPFNAVFNEIYSRGLGSILINKTADTLFLDTEQELGGADRFIGKRN